jgi:hypothetical protein
VLVNFSYSWGVKCASTLPLCHSVHLDCCKLANVHHFENASISLTCRFLQGPETDRGTVKKIRDAIDNQTEVTVQLINYTKSGMLLFTCLHILMR